jgi:hypothetical protein
MGDTRESGHWLVLLHQLPPERAYLRVKVRRRLQAIGAVPIKAAAYVLPVADDLRESFEWLRAEIVADGGQAMVAEARFLEGLTDLEIVGLFQADRADRYEEIVQQASAGATEGALSGLRARLERRLSEATELDFFGSPERVRAEQAIARLSDVSRKEDMSEKVADRGSYRGRTWVTRPGVKVDRMASAWLIRRFIDPDARFLFGGEATGDGLRFDMYEGEFTHVGDRCTFEVLADRFDVRDAGVAVLREIVHDLDVKDERYGRPERAGVAAVVNGLIASHAEDGARIAAALSAFDLLHAGLAASGSK